MRLNIMKKIVSLFIIFFLTGCSYSEFLLDPISAIVDDENSPRSSTYEYNSQSHNSNTQSSSDGSVSDEFKDVTPPTFYVANQNASRFNNKFSVNIDDLESYDFSAQSIGLSANDYLTDLTASIRYEHSGLSKSENGRTLWYTNYYVYDEAGNGTKLSVGFPAYQTLVINENNFYDYFDLKRTYRDGLDLDGLTVTVITQMKPTSRYDSISVLESDLTVTYLFELEWTQDTFQGDPYNGNRSANTRIASNTYSQGFVVERRVPSDVVIDNYLFSGERYLKASTFSLPNTKFVTNDPFGSKGSFTQYSPSVSFRDMSWNIDVFIIFGSLTIRIDL